MMMLIDCYHFTQDYIFMTDATGRLDDNGDYVHALWLKKKQSWRAYRFPFKGDPRGMKVLSEKEESFENMGKKYKKLINLFRK